MEVLRSSLHSRTSQNLPDQWVGAEQPKEKHEGLHLGWEVGKTMRVWETWLIIRDNVS